MTFKNQKIAQMAGMVLAFLGAKELPLVEGKVQFSDEQTQKLQASLDQKTIDELLQAFNKEIENDPTVEGFQTQISALLKEHGVSQEEVAQQAAAAQAAGNTMDPGIQAIANLLEQHTAAIQKLVNSAEDDTPIAQIKGALDNKLKHTATHVFGTGKEWDAYAGRPWNERLAGKTSAASDFSDEVTINKLNGDSKLYFRENPKELKSLHRDNFELPAFWPKRLNVDSTVSDGSILTAEITQGRKYGWLPKNVQEIEAEEGKIYPVQIDAEWSGFKLQQIEDSWLNFFNKEGSSPEKMSFVRFLVAELMKQARVEDRISTIRGIHVQTPDNAEKAGKMLQRQNGLLYQLWRARDINRKYRAFDMSHFGGAPTLANIKDYIDDPQHGMIAQLPEDVKNQPNLKLYMEKKYWDGYKDKYKELYGTHKDYTGLPEHPENYANIEVVPLIDLYGTGFMFFTFGDNIEILENIPAEKSAYRFQWILRNLHLMGDYKLGVRLIHIGRIVKDTDPEEFKVQSVWSNSQPVFPTSVYAPVYDNKSGILDVNFNNLVVDDKWETDIADLTNVKPGMIIRIKGNTSMSASKKVKNNTKIVIGSDFDLQSGGILTLYIGDDYKAMQIARTTGPATVAETDIDFNDADIDANEGVVFRYTGTADVTINSITGGHEGKKITIYGNDVTDVDVTFATGKETYTVGTTAVLSAAAHYIELVKIDGVWNKVKLVNS